MPDAAQVADWFFKDWTGPVRVVIVGVCAYVGLVFLLRVTGKRTLSKMNAFDLVVTVALGSTLAATLLNTSVPLANGLAGFAMLILVQFVVAWTCARSDLADRIVKSTPTVVLWRGEILREVMEAERLSEEEVLTAVRQAGLGSYDDVQAVVLETTGDISVIKKSLARQHPDVAPAGRHDALRGVNKYPGDDIVHPPESRGHE